MEKIWFNRYPEGVAQDINADQYQSIVQLFNESCQKFGDSEAFTCMGASMTFSELGKISKDFAAYLTGVLGLKKGDRIAIQMPNVLQYPVVMFGALRAGLVVVNTNPLYTAREMRHQFKDAGAKALVVLSNFASNVEEIVDDTEIEHIVVTQLGDLLGFPKSWLVNFVVKYIKKMVPAYKLPKAHSFFEALAMGAEKSFTEPSFESSDLAFLQYTGGTTGVSKGAMLTHKNIIANMLQITEWIKGDLVENKEVVITALPLYHIFSLTVNCLTFMKFGGKNVLITNPRDIPGFIKTLKSTDFTLVTGVNTLFNALMNHPDFTSIDFKTLKFSVAGAMALQKSVAERWKELTGTPVVEGYGLTEASPVVCCNPINGTHKIGTIGPPLPSTNVKILGEDGTEAPQGESGELCVFGPQVMKGYWQRQEETNKVIDSEGWLHTGDVAMVDNDGFAKIVDRKKDMILVSGFNVYPNEVEDVVAGHEKVLEVAAVGIPDEKSGEVVKIFVVKKIPDLTEQELLNFCRENLVAYKVPKQVEFRSELPKTNVGKILRRALRPEAQA